MENASTASKWPMIACGVAVVISLGLAGYFYTQNQQLKKDPAQIGQERANQVLQRFSQIIVVPTGEEPTVAEVTDPDLLKDHPFLARAKKGDFIIVYPQAQKAYLYDPIAHKIIDVGSVTNGSQASQSAAPEETGPTQ